MAEDISNGSSDEEVGDSAGVECHECVVGCEVHWVGYHDRSSVMMLGEAMSCTFKSKGTRPIMVTTECHWCCEISAEEVTTETHSVGALMCRTEDALETSRGLSALVVIALNSNEKVPVVAEER